MPFIEVKIFEERLTPETEAALLTELSGAVGRTLGPDAEASTWVVLHGTPAQRWAVAGEVQGRADRDDVGAPA
ncbi:hypothetical protein GCM10009718_17210 [Isoptericola halotolerans]|uniref:4-oxalocrotonate tautomerase n=1 Tax=Isoptericola halotolerans TaxID=300560 RepID=A0ABX2A9F8_9MICO|nr:4-oxalocrotonate tautomerase [Isoptericola halotolerans]